MSANTLEFVCENMLTHVHKIIHLVVSNLIKGGKVGEVEEASRGDRTCLGSDRTWRPASGQWRTVLGALRLGIGHWFSC